MNNRRASIIHQKIAQGVTNHALNYIENFFTQLAKLRQVHPCRRVHFSHFFHRQELLIWVQFFFTALLLGILVFHLHQFNIRQNPTLQIWCQTETGGGGGAVRQRGGGQEGPVITTHFSNIHIWWSSTLVHQLSQQQPKKREIEFRCAEK